MAYAVEEQARRRTTVALAIVAGAVAMVVALVAVLMLRGGGEGAEPAPGGEAGSAAGDPGGTSPAPAAEVLNADTVVWQDLFGIPVPAGPPRPREVAGNRTTGFEQSPAGAVLAAINIMYQTQPSIGPAVFEPTIAEQVVGDDKATWLAKLKESYAEDKAQGRQTGPHGELIDALAQATREKSQVWGYRVDAYDSAAASVQVLMRTEPVGLVEPVFVNLALTVQWVEGDWRLVAPVDGDPSTGASQVDDVPKGYVVLGEG